jgi:hypothetical protein
MVGFPFFSGREIKPILVEVLEVLEPAQEAIRNPESPIRDPRLEHVTHVFGDGIGHGGENQRIRCCSKRL